MPGVQIEGEFPQILPIRESLIKYVFEPAAAKVSGTALSSYPITSSKAVCTPSLLQSPGFASPARLSCHSPVVEFTVAFKFMAARIAVFLEEWDLTSFRDRPV